MVEQEARTRVYEKRLLTVNKPVSMYQKSNLVPRLRVKISTKRNRMEVDGWVINFFCSIPLSFRVQLEF